jgi:hypothetical protein
MIRYIARVIYRIGIVVHNMTETESNVGKADQLITIAMNLEYSWNAERSLNGCLVVGNVACVYGSMYKCCQNHSGLAFQPTSNRSSKPCTSLTATFRSALAVAHAPSVDMASSRKRD